MDRNDESFTKPLEEGPLETKEDIIDAIRRLYAEVRRIRDTSEVEEMTVPSDEEIRAAIIAYTKDMVDGDQLCPSDVAFKYNIVPEEVERIMDLMLKEGYFR